MHKYHSDHDSGVVAYSFKKNSIVVLFHEGWYYLYDDDKRFFAPSIPEEQLSGSR